MLYSKIQRAGRPISVPEWHALIASVPYLELAPDIQGINPFTGERLVLPNRTKANFLLDSKLAGVIELGDIDLGEGILIAVAVPHAICEDIALKLGAAAANAINDDYCSEAGLVLFRSLPETLQAEITLKVRNGELKKE